MAIKETFNNLKITPKKICLEIDPKDNRYKLTHDIVYVYKNKEMIVPKGMLTDGASIPRIFWTLVGSPYQPRHLKAAIIHDYLYLKHEGKRKARKEADDLFYCILREDGVNKVRSWLMWAALRTAAWFYWNH